jgi:hypothetical protein
MPANGPVSLTRQTIYCFIPIMDMYAAYHIKKLRWYLLIMIGLSIAMGVVGEIVSPTDWTEDSTLYINDDDDVNWNGMGFEENPDVSIALILGNLVVTYALAVYLIRKWSREWNERLPKTESY